MVSIMKRMRRLRRLLNLKLGAGAATLPPEVSRIHMDFHVEGEGEHQGARAFWKNHLRRLKYHNPGVPMTVSRTKTPMSSQMTVHFSALPDPSSSRKSAITSTASSILSSGTITHSSPAPPTKRIEAIDMRELPDSEIWTRLQDLTGARDVAPTEEEEREIHEMEESARRAKVDRDGMQAAIERRRQIEAEFEAAVKIGE